MKIENEAKEQNYEWPSVFGRACIIVVVGTRIRNFLSATKSENLWEKIMIFVSFLAARFLLALRVYGANKPT